MSDVLDVIRFHPRWTVTKYANDEDFKNGKPFEVKITDGNLLSTAGATLLWTLAIGGAGQAFDNAHAYLGCGDDTTAAAAGQTDLQAVTNKVRKGMDAGKPSVATNVLTLSATFGSADANWAWNEMAVFNAAAAGTMLCRKVSAQGTKASGQTWVLTYTNTLS